MTAGKKTDRYTIQVVAAQKQAGASVAAAGGGGGRGGNGGSQQQQQLAPVCAAGCVQRARGCVQL